MPSADADAPVTTTTPAIALTAPRAEPVEQLRATAIALGDPSSSRIILHLADPCDVDLAVVARELEHFSAAGGPGADGAPDAAASFEVPLVGDRPVHGTTTRCRAERLMRRERHGLPLPPFRRTRTVR
jgi:hypothetical protein